MYHRQAQEFIAQSRGGPLSSDILSIFSSYLPLNYVSASTKITILAELIDRVDVGGSDELQAVMESPIWTHIPELLKSGNSEIWSLASQLSVLGDAQSANQINQLTPPLSLPPPTCQHPPRIWRNNLSRGIDESLLLEAELRRKKEIHSVKIIVLGPKDCGKTTLLKGLRSGFAPKAFRAEMDAWRPAIRLNLVRSINFVINPIFQSSQSSELKQLAMKIAPLTYKVEETLFSCIAPPEMILQAGWYRFSRVAEFSSPNVLIPFRREHMREEEERASRPLSACASDMQELWTSSEMQMLLEAHKIELRTQPGFFLDDLQRICDENYIPTTNDILRTRVHNPYAEGPEKHDIEGESSWKAGTLTAYEMRGALTTSEQGMLHHLPSLSETDIPTSSSVWKATIDFHGYTYETNLFQAFDEVYQENGIEFNPLEQSFKQWRAICSNNLLASVNLTVCITKIDILRHKIQSGKQFSQYVTSYLDEPNDADAILAYVYQKVKNIHRQHLSTYKYKGALSVTCICATNPSDIRSLMYSLRANVVRETLHVCQLV
ncbi:G-protein alpha subunit-domain-containing protein [Favolaschia claudopus]|uniref:G-protein alpha subunit-domain-containing protein n=1 Tax=Favolaschia claudopus TaxID=2862362 RepID=A0AAW0BQE6_9AGAR